MAPETNTQPDSIQHQESVESLYQTVDIEQMSSKLAAKIEEFDGHEVTYYTYEHSGDKVVVAKTQFMDESIHCLFVRSRYPHPEEGAPKGEMRVDFKLKQAFNFLAPNERKLIHDIWPFQLKNPNAFAVFRFFEDNHVTMHVADRHDEEKVRYHDFAAMTPSTETLQTLNYLIDNAKPAPKA